MFISEQKRLENEMDRDKAGNPVLYVIRDRKRTGTSWGFYVVAIFRFLVNAEKFLADKNIDSYYISCESSTIRFLSLARD